MNEIKRASVTEENGKTVVRINASAMSLLHACERKADYILNKGFGLSDTGSLAQNFGKAIHQAMAKYYSLPKEDHTAKTMTDIWAEIPFESDDPKKNKEVGAKMLHNYATVYANDPWRIAMIDAKPAVEIGFESLLVSRPDFDIRFFGTIDMIVQHEETGEHAIMDHKTGTSLGKEFLSRWKPNHQMSGYIWAMGAYFSLDTNKAIINGLQVAKTVQNVCRVETYRTQEELIEFSQAVEHFAEQLLIIQDSSQITQADSMVCSQWGGCRFLDACATTPSLRPAILESLKLQGGYEYGHAAE